MASMISALAALGALVFLWLTVRGAQALGRAQRRGQLLELAADLDEAGMKAMTATVQDRGAWRDARTARHRFRGAVDATGERLPECRALLEIDWSPASIGDAERRIAEADLAIMEAQDELAARLPD